MLSWHVCYINELRCEIRCYHEYYIYAQCFISGKKTVGNFTEKFYNFVNIFFRSSFCVQIPHKTVGISLSIVFIVPFSTRIVEEGRIPADRVTLNLTRFPLFRAIHRGEEDLAVHLLRRTGKSFPRFDTVSTP